ncbi:MAG: SDR family oxidoreductase [Zoogloeaceae bacterium]|jgi:NAD(P)-dependent dehydrogenase (short-subunit alcohol dehydrogenase family)|nr:SDR family oxidoreductase [Zoogloeaceae bacterium]
MKRIALVAGATGVLGSAICRELHAQGLSVACGYATRQQEAQTLADELGGSAVELRAGANLAEATRVVGERHGGLDILVNAAGINREGNALALSQEEWRCVLEVNLDFAFSLTQAVLPHMLLRRYGRVIHLSSVAGRFGGRGQISYAVSKAALERMARAFALEVGRKGITVNCVAPGVIVSDMTERVRAEHGEELLSRIACRRFGEPGEIAKAVAFLAGEDAGYINGVVLPVDGGMSL